MRLPRVSPARAHQLALVSLALLTVVVFTGAAVRLTGSGLACPNWPACNEGQVITGTQPEWIEFGNRLFSGLVGVAAVLAFLAMWRRDPRRRELLLIAALPAIGVAAQGAIGALTVKHELKPGFVITHFLLSFLILIFAALLVWRSKHPVGTRPRSGDRLAVWGVRALLPLVTVLVVAGTFATAAGPHPGSRATGEVTDRLDWFGTDTLETLLVSHGRIGTAILVFTLLLIAALVRRGAPRPLVRRLVVLVGFYLVQGAVGLYQYEYGLPAEAVWVHIVLATVIWLLVLFAIFEAGRLHARGGADAARPGPAPERHVAAVDPR